ncbi:MAG TPA: Rrf2 family transcriptional regulator [Cyclobacteriaceae bacterium]|nr:Rrf2 family transcriptional regulator [Cyclobacteriaceae bacterium]
MRLSTKTLYGTRLMFELALTNKKGVIRLSEIVRNQGLSEKYSEQIISQLKAAGLVIAQRGAEGGYMLAKPAASITMKDIVQTLEGSLMLLSTDEESEENESSIFITRNVWEKISSTMEEALSKITLGDLVNDYINRSSELHYEI